MSLLPLNYQSKQDSYKLKIWVAKEALKYNL